MADLERLMSKDHDMVGYSVGGRKYVGWHELQLEMQQEFETVTRLDIPIKELHVWERGDFAWYTAEIEYIRYESTGAESRKMLMPLRESGVLERRHGRWLLVQWHESLERAPETVALGAYAGERLTTASQSKSSIDVSGEWAIQEEDKTYQAVLDASGNGSYTWQQGTLVTTRLNDGYWEGVWQQSGNDREGGFEVRLSEDGMTARGTWWYTRVGSRSNIPPRQWGGGYRWTRLNSMSVSDSSP
ncbi:MAG: nuclear transport factor 2 family protein [Nitrospirota bacterium]|nr:nuclear transport factor 2 family protein [Nitrospirota bacterium]